MIPRIIFSACLVILFMALSAEKPEPCHAGIYLSKEDFIKSHLSHKIDESVKGEKLIFTFPADLTLTIKVIDKDSSVKFKPGSIFGYYECGNIYRYAPGKEVNVQEDYYKIEEADGLVLYSSLFVNGSELFYSRSTTSNIHRLTMKNIEEDFKDHPAFIKEVKKLHRKVGGDITARDKKGAFLINKIYRQTIGSGNEQGAVER